MTEKVKGLQRSDYCRTRKVEIGFIEYLNGCDKWNNKTIEISLCLKEKGD